MFCRDRFENSSPNTSSEAQPSTVKQASTVKHSAELSVSHPKRGKKKYPLCDKRVVHIPRHLQGKHKWTKDASQGATHFFGLRKPYETGQKKSLPKFTDYHHHRRCPMIGCGAVVKRLPPHLRQVHGISKASPAFAKLLKKAQSETRSQKLQLNYGLDLTESRENTNDDADSGDEIQSEDTEIDDVVTEDMNEQTVELSDDDCRDNDSETDLFDFDETCDQSKGSANFSDLLL